MQIADIFETANRTVKRMESLVIWWKSISKLFWTRYLLKFWIFAYTFKDKQWPMEKRKNANIMETVNHTSLS